MRTFVADSGLQRCLCLVAVIATSTVLARPAAKPAQPTAVVQPPPAAPRVFRFLKYTNPVPTVISAIQAARNDIAGCFEEWEERADNEFRQRRQPVELWFWMSADPDGVGKWTRGEGDDSRLTMCAGAALHRVRYPRSTEHTDFEVEVAWSGTRVVLIGQLAGHRADVPDRCLELHGAERAMCEAPE
jgi:hypothetical protein